MIDTKKRTELKLDDTYTVPGCADRICDNIRKELAAAGFRPTPKSNIASEGAPRIFIKGFPLLCTFEGYNIYSKLDVRLSDLDILSSPCCAKDPDTGHVVFMDKNYDALCKQIKNYVYGKTRTV